MTTLRLILGDQLNANISALSGLNKDTDVVLLAEVKSETTYVKHHKKKIVFVLSAMRHFAEELREQGTTVKYIDLDHADNQGNLMDQLKWCVHDISAQAVVMTHPGEYRLLSEMQQFQNKADIPVEIRPDNRFLVSHAFFTDWAEGRKELRMEYFYREMRKQTGYLMEGQKPAGGKWNFDKQNREPMPQNYTVPERTAFEADEITCDVIKLVTQHFSDHFGDLEPFDLGVTRNHALAVLDDFIEHRLPDFGRFQDAMVSGQPWMFHSHISFYLNAGLLQVKEVVEAAINAYNNEAAPLNSVEGFVRQIIGWREYVRGFYWYFMPELATKNALNAKRDLPDFFWTGETKMNCLHQCISETKANAYAHHIQRLMVLGNFLLLTGITPKAVNEWYLLVYADAYEWVEMPNVSSMILYADNGVLASKPYAASGSYINKMSDYCSHCQYKVTKKTGADACPFNYLYWHFIYRQKAKLENNHRMGMIYNTLSRMEDDKVRQILDDGDTFLLKLDNNEEV